MNPQTAHNKKGHAIALGFGFEACGPTIYGWRDAKVACAACGHLLPWYHHHYQRRHRLKCKAEGGEKC